MDTDKWDSITTHKIPEILNQNECCREIHTNFLKSRAIKYPSLNPLTYMFAMINPSYAPKNSKIQDIYVCTDCGLEEKINHIQK